MQSDSTAVFGGLLGGRRPVPAEGDSADLRQPPGPTEATSTAPVLWEVEPMSLSSQSPSILQRADGRRQATFLLEVSGLHKAFGGLPAVDHVDLTVDVDTITGLIGPNGSGKTTLFNLIDGTVRAQSGRISLMGRSIERRGRASRAHAGLARTYQMPRLFASLTVVENLVAPEASSTSAGLWSLE